MALKGHFSLLGNNYKRLHFSLTLLVLRPFHAEFRLIAKTPRGRRRPVEGAARDAGQVHHRFLLVLGPLSSGGGQHGPKSNYLRRYYCDWGYCEVVDAFLT